MPGEVSIEPTVGSPPQAATKSAGLRRWRYLTASRGLTGWAPRPRN